MPYLVRKITLSKWQIIDAAISGDAITSCLRTTSNTLSFWRIDELTIENLNEVVLALATSPNNNRLSKVDIVAINEDFFSANNIALVEEPGSSLVSELVDNHRDAININITRIQTLSNEIMNKREEIRELDQEQLKTHLSLHSFSLKEVIGIVKSAVETGRLDPSALQPDVRESIS